jgi:hypothetical protein
MSRTTRSVLVLVLVAACGTRSEAEPASPAPAPTFSSFADAGADAGGNAGPAECSEATKDPFVVTEELMIYSFHPPTLEFKSVGKLACPPGKSGATPTSMAVDRQGFAWVRYTDGSIWKVSTVDLSCAATAYVPPASTAPFFKFGMGFSSSSAGSSTEDLFLSDSAGKGTAKLDLATMKVGFIGPYTGAQANQRAELTGTGDGKLFAMFATTQTDPCQVAEVSKVSGAVLSVQTLSKVTPGDAYAFSFYGGDFYLYTHNPATATNGSDVTRYRPSDQTVVVVKAGVGFTIVGAGVSTCAPTTIVH